MIVINHLFDCQENTYRYDSKLKNFKLKYKKTLIRGLLTFHKIYFTYRQLAGLSLEGTSPPWQAQVIPPPVSVGVNSIVVAALDTLVL